jgi:hypothetical protein
VRVMTPSGSTKPVQITNGHCVIFRKTALFNDDAVKTPNLTKYDSSQLIVYLHVQFKMESPRILNLSNCLRIIAANLDFAYPGDRAV